MSDLDTLLVIGTFATVFVMVVTIVVDRYLAVEARQTELFMQLYDRLDDSDFQANWSEVTWNWRWEDLQDFFEKYGYEKNLDAWSRAISVAHYFEGIGVLVKRKMIDIELVIELMSTDIKSFWEKIGQITKEIRQLWNNPHLWENFEYLYNEIDRREKRKAEQARRIRAPT